jgi:hypothetical protein
VDFEQHRSEAARLFNECWILLELNDRTADNDAALLTNAFASRHHWHEVGALEQWIIADWMVARAAAAVGDGDLAVRFAHRAYDTAQDPDIEDWLVASTAEGLARSYAATGDAASRDEWFARATELAARIGDDESRAIITGQLASVPRN